MLKKLMLSLVVLLSLSLVTLPAFGDQNLGEYAGASGFNQQGYYVSFMAHDYLGEFYASINVRDDQNRPLFYCYGYQSSDPIDTSGSAKAATISFTTDDLPCFNGYGGSADVSAECTFNGERYRHQIGSTTMITEGEQSKYNSNYKTASCDCTVKVDSIVADIPGTIVRDTIVTK